MATKYPNSIDTTSDLPSKVDGWSVVDSASINELREAIIAIEVELGINPSGSFDNLKDRVGLMEAVLSGVSAPSEAVKILVTDSDGYFVSDNVEGVLTELGVAIATIPPPQASNISLLDADGYYSSSNVEDALQELGPAIPFSASTLPIVDADGYYASSNVEGALAEVGQYKTGVVSYTSNNVSDGYKYSLIYNLPFDITVVTFTGATSSGTVDGYICINDTLDLSSYLQISTIQSTANLSIDIGAGNNVSFQPNNQSLAEDISIVLYYKR